MAEVLRRLEIRRFDPSESDYVSDLHQYENMLDIKRQEVARSEQDAARAKEDTARAKQDAVHAKQDAVHAKQDAVRQKERAEKAEKKRRDELSNAVKAFLALGKDVPYIAGILGLTVDETNGFAQQN